jgi:hypothetical protein
MIGGDTNEAVRLALGNITLLALLAALSTLLLGYFQCAFLERRASTDFSLRKLETVELVRALLLYRMACDRLREIYLESAKLSGGVRRERRRRKIEFREKFASELQDLGDYTKDLRSAIVRIRSRPLHRFTSWARFMSLEVAFRRSIDAYFLIAISLSALFLLSQGAAGGRSVTEAIDTFTHWRPFDGGLTAGWLLIGTVVGVLPIAYFRHRSKLRRLHAEQVRSLEDLASADAERLSRYSQADATADQGPTTSLDLGDGRSCFEVLGVSPSANVQEVKQAYKILVKQTHPDRVQDMAPIIKQVAESETKKLNVAYAEALGQLGE